MYAVDHSCCSSSSSCSRLCRSCISAAPAVGCTPTSLSSRFKGCATGSSSLDHQTSLQLQQPVKHPAAACLSATSSAAASFSSVWCARQACRKHAALCLTVIVWSSRLCCICICCCGCWRVQVGRQEPVMVLRVDKDKGYIDLSKRCAAATASAVVAAAAAAAATAAPAVATAGAAAGDCSTAAAAAAVTQDMAAAAATARQYGRCCGVAAAFSNSRRHGCSCSQPTGILEQRHHATCGVT